MYRTRLFGSAALLLMAISRVSMAQSSTLPAHPLGITVATSTEPASASIRVLSTGRVLVNDVARRRLVLLDSTLGHGVVVADTTNATGKAYGQGLIGLIPFSGDSSLIQDQTTSVYLVIDPNGKIARLLPRFTLSSIGGVLSGPPVGFDQAGHLLFRASSPIFLSLLDASFVGDTLMTGPDSNPVFRMDLGTHKVDTAAMLQAPRLRQAVTKRGAGQGGVGRAAVNPIKSSDDWTLLNDGTLAIVRVRDYHIDWVQPNGKVTAGSKIPTKWVPIPDARKVAIMDSVRRLGAGAANPPVGPAGNPAAAGAPVRPAAAAAAAGAPPIYVLPSDLPDFVPPFLVGSTLADADGNVWVRVNPALGTTTGAVYDVLSRTTGLVDRVQTPAGTTIVGFGAGVVYLSSGAGPLSRLSKVRIH